MKRGTSSHPKTLALARALDVDVAQAMGILEMLCNHFAPAYCPQGDIGKWSDLEIAEGLQTTLPAERLVPALVRARWLDEHPKHRLVIHDWAVHSDRGVKNRLRSWGVEFVGSDRGPTRVRRRSDPGRLGTGSGTGLDPSGSEFSSGSSSGSGARAVPKSDGGTRLAYPCPLLAEWQDEAIKLGLPEDQVESVFEEFCDYWHGVPGAKGRKTNWLGTWRNNVRRAVARLSTTPTSRNGGGRWTHPKTAGNVAAAEEFLRRHRARKENDADGS